jgi:hypothetical protein
MCRGLGGLKAHSLSIHGVELLPTKIVECPECRGKFGSREGFVSHFKAVHVVSKPDREPKKKAVPTAPTVEFKAPRRMKVVDVGSSKVDKAPDGRVPKPKKKKKPKPPSGPTTWTHRSLENSKDLPIGQGSRRRGTITCLLCGKRVPRGTLLDHKRNVHGEAESPPSLGRWGGGAWSGWVTIWSGGLPGLGRRR